MLTDPEAEKSKHTDPLNFANWRGRDCWETDDLSVEGLPEWMQLRKRYDAWEASWTY